MWFVIHQINFGPGDIQQQIVGPFESERKADSWIEVMQLVPPGTAEESFFIQKPYDPLEWLHTTYAGHKNMSAPQGIKATIGPMEPLHHTP